MAVLMNGLQTQQMPITLAHALGYFKDEGLDITMENLGTNAKTLQALVGGSVDVAGAGYVQIIQVAAEGQRVRTFFTGVRRSSTVVLVSQAASNRIRRFEDLKGTVVGIPAPGSPNQLFLNYCLKAHGVPLESVSVVGIGNGPPAIAAIEAGRVDTAIVSGGDHLRILRRSPGTRILLDSSTPEGAREMYGGDLYASGVLTARQEWLDRNPEAARRMARAAVRALRWIATHTPEEIRGALPEGSRSEDAAEDVAVIRWSLPSFTADGAMAPGSAEAMKRVVDATSDKVREAKIDLAATWTNEFLPELK